MRGIKCVLLQVCNTNLQQYCISHIELTYYQSFKTKKQGGVSLSLKVCGTFIKNLNLCQN